MLLKFYMGVKIEKCSWAGADPQCPQIHVEQTTLVRLHLASLGFISIYNNIFIIMINADIVTSGIGSDNMSLLEDYIIFLI